MNEKMRAITDATRSCKSSKLFPSYVPLEIRACKMHHGGAVSLRMYVCYVCRYVYVRTSMCVRFYLFGKFLSGAIVGRVTKLCACNVNLVLVS